MSQRGSGYERKERDAYETPEWVTKALLDNHIGFSRTVWEPACGSGKMVKVLADEGYKVYATDIETGKDFLQQKKPSAETIITNPPYALATEFIEHALKLTKPVYGNVAMLLRTDFDHAHSRRFLFADNLQFAKKLVLTKRIIWFEGLKAQPSFNHAWFIWDWQNRRLPILEYGP